MTEIGGSAKKDDGSEKQYLNVMIHEAWGLADDRTPMWDERFTDGYVRVELRGGPKTQKFSTHSQRVENFTLRWDQEIRLELTDEYKELRIMLCKEAIRDSHIRRSSNVVAACGIYLDQILEAVPIDKAFELFKAGDGQKAGSIGGFIRVTLKLGNAVPKITTIEEDEVPQEQLELVPTRAEDSEAVGTSDASSGKKMRIMRNILLLAGAAAAVAIVRVKTHERKKLT